MRIQYDKKNEFLFKIEGKNAIPVGWNLRLWKTFQYTWTFIDIVIVNNMMWNGPFGPLWIEKHII